jgi:hypothetical protein
MNEPDTPDQEQIANQQNLLETYRRMLVIHLRQQALAGGAPFAAPSVINGINEARASIRRIKGVLRDWSVQIVDSPDDEEDTTLLHQGGRVSPELLQLITARTTTVPTIRDPVPDFIDREREIEQLVRALTPTAAGAVPMIVGVRGMGGIGKTELAHAAARRLEAEFRDGQVLVDLQGMDRPLPPALALQAVLRVFTPRRDLPQDVPQLQELYRSALAGKRILILADDARDAAQVRPLLPPAGAALLITTRQRFALPGMVPVDLQTLPEDAAVRLLLTICPRIGAAAQHLAKLCGYLPLALRVSASLLASDDTLRVDRYLGRLSDERMRLAQLRDPEDSDLDVEASLRLSYDALDQTVQEVLSQLSLFTGSFDLAAANAVVNSTSDIEEVLGRLRRYSLLEWDEAICRYGLHDLVRAFAALRLGDKRAAVEQRHLVWSAQKVLTDWQMATDPQQQHKLRSNQQERLIQLWYLLSNDLRLMAQELSRGGLASDSESLALNMFAQIVFSIPGLRLDPTSNIRHELLSCARHETVLGYQRTYATVGDAC